MKQINVLIVDDDEINNEIVTLVLSKPFSPKELAWYNIKDEVRCQVYTATDAIEASLVMSQHLPDVILLDIEMPYMDGFQFLKSLRDEDDTKTLPVIMLTASADRNTVYRAAKLGAVGYLKKPFLPEDLVRRILRTVSSSLHTMPHISASEAESDKINLDAILEDLMQQEQEERNIHASQTKAEAEKKAGSDLASLMQSEMAESGIDASLFDSLFKTDGK